MTEREYDPIVLDIPATYSHLELVEPCVQLLLKQIGDLEEQDVLAYNLTLGIHEICANVARHAYQDQSGGRIAISMAYERPARQIVIVIEDQGRSFNPEAVPVPDLEQGQTGGYGLFLVRSLFDHVSYMSVEGTNSWRLVKEI